MSRTSCPREDDVLTLVTTGRWPDRASEELRGHASGCAVCADLALVAEAIEGELASPVVPDLPNSGTVWWRAQLRARQDAVKESGRPITIAHGALLAVAGGLTGAIFGATTGWFQRGLHAGRDAVASVVSNIHLPTLPASESGASWLSSYGTTLTVAGLLIVAATAVVVWAFREE